MRNNALIFILLTIALVLISLIIDRGKTKMGLKKGLTMFKGIAPPFLNILILVSVALYLIPPAAIATYLGNDSGTIGLAIAAIVGSITMIPGFISYPLAGALIGQGASYTIVATFMTTLMMVGVVTFPLESKYLGNKVAAIRNLLNLFAAIIIGLLVGVFL